MEVNLGQFVCQFAHQKATLLAYLTWSNGKCVYSPWLPSAGAGILLF